MLLPWNMRRRFMNWRFGYRIHPAARIGISWVFPANLIMGENSSIGHLNIFKDADLVELGEWALLGNLNWITAYPKGCDRHFSHQPDRKPQLVIGDHAAVTNRHLIDCTNSVTIGSFSTFAGFRSQILTHSIDLAEGKQSSAPVTIGRYCFVGTGCVLLGGAILPDYSILCAMSLLNRDYTDTYRLYAGVPAKPIKALDKDLKYFTRETGFIN